MKLLFLILFSFQSFLSYTYNNIEKYEQDIKKTRILLIGQSLSYTGTLLSLNSLWYKDFPKSSFHFINDNEEWLQMDKIGHITTSYHMGLNGIKAYKWAGFNRKAAIWYGGLSGSFFLTTIEVLDGFSKEWGASKGDLLANTIGSALCISQELLWKKQRVQIKYSYSRSRYIGMNNKQLGENLLQNFIKDYNGQKYWLTFNLHSFLSSYKLVPNYLGFSIGYSGNGMIHPYHIQGDPVRNREFFFSFDIDLNRIKTKSKFVNSIFQSFGFLKFPMPGIKLSKNKISFHSIIF